MCHLSHKAMLVSLSMSCWRATKLDRDASRQVCEANSAETDAARVVKRLLSQKHLSPITRIQTQARTVIYEMTLPWLDNGVRVLPSDLFFPFREKMQELERAHSKAVAEFLDHYEERLADARLRLVGLFNPFDFPTRDQVERKFGMKVSVMPFPEVDDFRVEQADELREEFEEQARKREAEMVADLAGRIANIAGEFTCKVNGGKRFWNSLTDKVSDLAKLVDGLNVTGNPDIAEAGRLLREIAAVKPDDLRDDPKAKAEAVGKADLAADKCRDLANIF